jgi:KUP system potassium uptake protein
LFYNLVPPPLLFPMVLLATVATVIASQALISGAFSLASQAIRLGLFPRLTLLHTHERHAGQIYVPFVNWSLFAGCVLLVATFGSSAALAAAYGLAVSGVMVITSIAMFRVALVYWNWRPLETGVIWGALLAVNIAFLVACLLKFVDGGYVPLSIGVVLFLVMATWRWGRKATFAAYSAKSTMTMAELVELHRGCSAFMERNAVVMAAAPLRQPSDRTPAIMQMLWERHGILPRNLLFVEVTHRKVPYIRDNRYRVTVFDRDHHRGSIVAVEISFGFMEEPNVERLLEEMARHKQIDLPTDRRQWVVHASQENLLPSRRMNDSGACDFVCSCCYGWFRSPPITITGLATRYSYRSRSFRCGCDRPKLLAPPRAFSARAFSATPCCRGRLRRRTARPDRRRSAC